MGTLTETLRAGNVSDVHDVASGVFGNLVKLVSGTLTAYHGDLYHDALWINEHLHGTDFTFFYAYNESGTNIGTDETVVTTCGRKHVYRVHVRAVDNRATVNLIGA